MHEKSKKQYSVGASHQHVDFQTLPGMQDLTVTGA